MIIVAPTSDLRKTWGLIHCHSGIAVADFQVHARYSVVSCAFYEVVEQTSADAAAVAAWAHGEQQKLGFVGHGTKERKAHDGVTARLTCKDQRHAAHRQDAGELRPGPRLSEPAPERA